MSNGAQKPFKSFLFTFEVRLTVETQCGRTEMPKKSRFGRKMRWFRSRNEYGTSILELECDRRTGSVFT
jgi:hypothetical protein